MVLLDYVMPGLDGEATYHKLKRAAPNVKVLVSSGYDEGGQVRSLLEAGAEGFIQKPYELPELSVALRDILDRA